MRNHAIFRYIMALLLNAIQQLAGRSVGRSAQNRHKLGQQNAICWNYFGLFRDYGLDHIFLGIKLFFLSGII